MVAIDENTCPNYAKPDTFFVPKKAFEALKSKVEKGSKITDKEVDSLVNWTCKNDETVIPVDMNGAGENLDDFEAALKKLGAAKTVACFVDAHQHFEANKHKIPQAERAKPMTAKEYKVENDEDDEEEDDDEVEDDAIKYRPDLFHVPKAAFEAIKVKLSNKQDVSKQEVDALVNWTAPDSEILMPVDMNGGDEDLDDFDEMLEKLGPKTIAECFVQAEKHLEKKKSLLPAEKLKLITIREWNDGGYEEDEEADAKAAEEEADDEDEDDNSDQDEDDDEDEPASKKAKTA